MALIYRNNPSHVPRIVEHLLDYPNMSICVYGHKKALSYQQAQEQGYVVSQDNVPLARAEMLEHEKQAVQAFLKSNYPEHATI